MQLRTREIGIRLALGAAPAGVRTMMMLQGTRLAVAGLAIGIVAAFGLTRLLAGLLFGVKASDPFVFVMVPLLLGGVALLAAWLPVRRATRINPMRALRTE